MRNDKSKKNKQRSRNQPPTVESHTLAKSMITRLDSNTIIIRLENTSPENFYQFIWLLEQLELYGFDCCEDAIRSHIDSRYWND